MNIKALAIVACAAIIGLGVLAVSPDLLTLHHHVGIDGGILAGMLGIPLNQRARGLVAIRADGGSPDINALLGELAQTFENFKTEHKREIDDLKKNKGDVVQSEKVDRINAEITKLQKAIDDTNAVIAALKVGGGGDRGADPDRKAYAAGFERYFRRGVDAGLNDLAIKAKISTDSDPDGGYVTPDTMESTIDRVLSTVSAIRSISRVITISTSEYKKLVNKGGATGGWVGERESRSETGTPTLAELKFPAMELYAQPAATQTALDDAAINIEQWLADEVSIVFAEMEGAAFVSGDGNNKPRGILSYDAIANASYTWGKLGYAISGVAAALSDSTHNGGDALIDTVYALKQGYRPNARWLMNRSTQAAIRKLKSKTEELYLWQPSIQAGQPATILGYPVVDDDNMQDIGASAFPVAFGDFQRGYLIVDRQGVRVLRDPFTAKPYVLFYTTKRVGGGIQNFEAIKLLKIGTS